MSVSTYESKFLPDGQLLRLIAITQIAFLKERRYEGMENRLSIKVAP